MWTHGAPRARLVLENGSVWHGYAFGAEGPCLGEDVFNTNMTGYQEIITDSIYAGQIGSMTASKLATSASMPITTRPDGLSCGLSPRRLSGCFASSSRPIPAASARRCPLVPRDGLRLWHQAQHPAPLGKPRLPRHRRLGGVSSKPCSKKRVNDSWRGFCSHVPDLAFRAFGGRVAPMHIFLQKVWLDCKMCPKRNWCDEIAMPLMLDEERAARAEREDGSSLPVSVWQPNLIPVEVRT